MVAVVVVVVWRQIMKGREREGGREKERMDWE